MPTVLIPDVTVTLAEMTCGECQIVFAVPVDFKRRRLDDHRDWHCPNGHVRHFMGQTEAERLRDELAREKHGAEQARAYARDLSSRIVVKDRQLAARKGQVTRIKNRVANGVCPCCNRHFEDLHRHMQIKHAGWSPESESSSPETAR